MKDLIALLLVPAICITTYVVDRRRARKHDRVEKSQADQPEMQGEAKS